MLIKDDRVNGQDGESGDNKVEVMIIMKKILNKKIIDCVLK